MAKGDVVNSFNISPRELETIIQDLNRANSTGGGRSKRRLKRWTLQQQKVILTIIHPNGAKVHGVAIPRNLSKKGAALLYGCFVHPSTKCFITLRCVDGTTRSVPAKVVHSRHVKGRLHDLGLEFTGPVNPRDFFIVLGNDYLFNREQVDIRGVTGKVLIVDDSTAMQRLIAHDLRTGDLTLIFARTGKEGLDCMTDEPDLMIVDYGLPDMNGIDFVRQVRELGYLQPVLLTTAEKDKELRLAGIGAGASEMLFKPIAADLLHRAVAEYLAPDDALPIDPAAQQADDQSKLSSDDVSAFVEELTKIAKELDQAFEASNADAVRAQVLELTSTASQFGFQAVSDQASEVLRLLELSGGLPRAASEIRRLIRICERARSPA